jgi:hypothetical protein
MAANGVKNRHKDYDRFSDRWRRVRDVVSGQDAIYNAGAIYLPYLAEEDPAEYLKRLKRTPFYNATWRTMASFVGMMFRKPPIVEVPDKLKPLLDDVTMSGISFENFAQDVTLEDIEISRVGVLVDFPQGAATNEDGTPISVAQAEANSLRPSMVMYKAEAIINWRFEFINNRQVLTQVRLWEQQEDVKNEFETETYAVIRVLDLNNGKYRVRRFKEENEEQIGWDIYPTLNGKPLDKIPFYFIGPDGGESDLSEPVLIDLVDLNIKHFQVSADYEHGCHMTGLPTPVIIGLQPEGFTEAKEGAPSVPIYPKIYVGSTTALILPAASDAKYMEFTGQGLTALKENLATKEAQMAALGARMLTPEKAGVEAADTVAMRHAGEYSILSAIAVAVSEGLTEALKMFALWAGQTVTEDNIKFEINRDFIPFPITAQNLTALLGVVQAGKMSHEAFFDLLKRGDLYDSELDFETEQGRIDAAPSIPAPVPGAPNAQPGQAGNGNGQGNVEPTPKQEPKEKGTK